MPSHSWTHRSADGPVRLDALVAGAVDGLSRAAAQRIIREGFVSVDGRVITKPSFGLSDGQTVEATIEAAPSAEVRAVPSDLTVVYEDQEIVVIDKPAGLTVHPGSGHLDDTLVNHLLARFPVMADVGARDRPGVVHRLDRDTSGLLVFALTPAAYVSLVRQLKKRLVTRTYMALVFGQPTPESGAIDAPIGRDPNNRLRQSVVTTGRVARTKYRTSRQIGHWTMLEVELETGRMHQIRVHMAAAGYPVAGDPTYGSAPEIPRLHRQFLHASRLGLNHPISDRRIEFNSPLPNDLQLVLDELISYRRHPEDRVSC